MSEDRVLECVVSSPSDWGLGLCDLEFRFRSGRLLYQDEVSWGRVASMFRALGRVGWSVNEGSFSTYCFRPGGA